MIHIRHLLLIITVLLLAVFMGSCSSKNQHIELSEAAATTTAQYQIINLTTGEVDSQNSIPDLITNDKYRSTHMVFSLVPAGNAILGAATSDFGASVDDAQRSVEMPKYYVGVFEITQAQWQRLTNTQPWQDIIWSTSSDAITNAGNNLPAYGLSRDLVNSALSTWMSGADLQVQLPTNDQWEYACRAGSNTVYYWGNEHSSDTANIYASVYETAQSDGPEAVGSRSANAFGIYDMHGSCWELTREGDLRGGSWHDPISLARSSHKNPISADTTHALVGARLLYLP